MNTPLWLAGLAAIVLMVSCANEPKVKPGVYETVASWQYPAYRQYTKGHMPVGTGVSLQIRADSTYEYTSFQMNMRGHWMAIDDSLHLYCDSVRYRQEMPLAEYYQPEPWTCPEESYSFVIGRNMFYKQYASPNGSESVMILEKVKLTP